MRKTYFLKTLLIFSLIVLLGNSFLFAQNQCSNNKITNGAFDGNANNWTLGGSWYYFNNTIRVDSKDSHIATSKNMELCQNNGKIIKFDARYSFVSTAEVFLVVSLGGVEFAKINWDNSFQGYDELNGATVSKSGNTFTIKINNYSGAANGNLQFTYNRVEGGQSGLLILDNIEVYETQPPKPANPTPSDLFYCSGDTADLTATEPTPITDITYEWYTVGSNPTPADKVSTPTAVTAGIYYLYAKSDCNQGCISEVADQSVTVTEKDCNDSDNDGILDVDDLDDDNDGILDTDECGNVETINVSETGYFIKTFTQDGTVKIQADFYTLDNSTRIEINGQNIVEGTGYNGVASTGILSVEGGGGLNNGDHLLKCSSGDFYAPWNQNNNGLPRLRIVITESGVQVTGTRNQSSTAMENVVLVHGNFVTNPNFSTGQNTVILQVPNGGGPDGAIVDFTMESNFCKDTDGDGIINRFDLDSDNDGCPDAIEGAGNITNDQLSGNNSINSGVDTDGVPTLVNGGQGVGDSQKATEIEITEQPQNQTVCIGDDASFQTKATAKITEVFNGGAPDYTNPTTEDVNYQWQKYNITTSAWEDIAGETGTANSTNAITLDLGIQNDTSNNDTKYRVKFTSVSMSCPKYSEEATLTVNKLPNNTASNGFKGKIICFETTAELTYNADNTDFVAPHTIVYENEDTGIQYTQTITTASAFQFEPGDTPTTVGTHHYKLLSITDGNGCVRTTGFGKDEADIIIREKPENLLTVSLDKTETCKDDTSPILTFANSDTKKIKVTYQINGGSEQTIDVNGNSQSAINIPTNTVGVFNYNIIKVSYKGNPKCEDIIDIKHCVAIFPQNNVAPTVNTGTGANVVATQPQTYTGFTIEYNFGDGAGWQTQNTKTLASKCEGYDIQTRYKLSGSCSGSDIIIACATSPTTNRIVDAEKPTFTKPAEVSLCVNNIINASYAETTNGDVNTPPDYYEFPANYTDLDITNVSDDCCDTNIIMWTITPASNGQSLSGTGQPSESIAGKKLWLDVATSNPKASYTEKEYTIKYRVKDCNGNESDEKSTTITIKPRPKITKVN